MRSTAKDIMELYQSSNKDEIAEYFPLLMNERLNCIFQKSVEPKIADYQEVADMLNGILELNIEAGHVKVLLDFYPYVKVKIAHNPATDTIMRDLIFDAVSDFFLGCPWPDREENINMDNYLDALTVQFKGFSTGFEIMSQLMVSQHQNTQDIQAEINSTERLSEMSNQDTVAALASAYAEGNENTSSFSLSFEPKEKINRNAEKQVESNNTREDEDGGEEDKVILSKKTYKEINGELNLFGENMLPPEEIDKILGDEYIKSQIVAWGIDTVVRDNLFETFVGYFLPEKYSEYGVSYQEKSEKLDEAVKAYVKAFKEKKDNIGRKCSEDEDDDKIILSKKTYKEINEDYLDLYGDDMLPPEEIDKILGDGAIKSQIVEWGFDTVVRENLFEILITYFVPHDHTLSYEDGKQKMLDAVKEYSRAFKEKNKKDLQS